MVIFNSKLLVIYTPMIFHVIIDVHHQGLSRWCGPGAVISGRDSFEPFAGAAYNKSVVKDGMIGLYGLFWGVPFGHGGTPDHIIQSS